MAIQNEKLKELGTRTALKLVDSFYVGISEAYHRVPLAKPSLYGLHIEKDIPYLSSSRNEHRLDIIRPKNGHGPLPVLFYIHGGGFRTLSKETHILFAMMFAKKGFLVVNINYRLAPAHPFPAAMEDTCAAYHWTVNNIAQYGGDIDRILVSGESAGANLATSLAIATCTRLPEVYAREVFDLGVVPKGVIPACGYLEVSRPERFHCGGIRGEITEGVMRILEKDYLPQSHLAGPLSDPLPFLEDSESTERSLPPFFIPIGGADNLVPDTIRLETALRKRGIDATAKIYPKRGHAFHAFIWLRQARECWRDIFNFSNSVLYSTEPNWQPAAAKRRVA